MSTNPDNVTPLGLRAISTERLELFVRVCARRRWKEGEEVDADLLLAEVDARTELVRRARKAGFTR